MAKKMNAGFAAFLAKKNGGVKGKVEKKLSIKVKKVSKKAK